MVRHVRQASKQELHRTLSEIRDQRKDIDQPIVHSAMRLDLALIASTAFLAAA